MAIQTKSKENHFLHPRLNARISKAYKVQVYLRTCSQQLKKKFFLRISVIPSHLKMNCNLPEEKLSSQSKNTLQDSLYVEEQKTNHIGEISYKKN